MTTTLIRLREICRPRQWQTLSMSQLSPRGFPVFGANGAIGFADSYTHEAPVLLVGCRGSCGTLHITPPRAYANGNAMALDDLDGSRVNIRWLFFFLGARGFADVISGSSQPQITQSNIGKIEIPLPPLSEQERTVRILDEAEALRRLRAEADERANQLSAALFEEIFGDPAANSGEWPVEPLGNQLALMEYGPRFYNEAYSASGTRIVRITDLDDTGNLHFDDMPRMEVDPSTLAARGLQPGDFIFARSGATAGKLALVPESAPPCIAGAYFIRFRLKDSVEPIFAREILRSGPIQRIVQQQSKQAAQPNFSGPLLRALPMIFPPLSLQCDFAARVAEIRELEKKQAASRQRLDVLFQSLLHRAFQGEL